tara:strand:- start:219 stop:1190 length:972 start_codon:yes stop_codon:yes gene_type:complete
MTNLRKCIVGIRDSKLSKAQTRSLINDANNFESNIKKIAFKIETIKTTGDIRVNERLDNLGGKGLFIKEIENQILKGTIDVGIHSMKDVPACDENEQLKIICWTKRADPSDAFISKSRKTLELMPSGSVIGTSSVRRRAQILNFRQDLQIKLLRGNIDTRLKRLDEGCYDGIILSAAGLKRIDKHHLITEVMDHSKFLPAACQGVVGVQAKNNNNFDEIFSPINHFETQIESIAERKILKIINANCNSPISVYAKIVNEKIKIKCDLFDHNGSILFRDSIEGSKQSHRELSIELGKKIIKEVGQKKVDKLNTLNNDFNYTPAS